MQKIKRGIQYIVYAFIAIQIGMGIGWLIQNITAIPCFGDSTEYINLSQSLQLDEYRTILYPLILRGAIAIGNRMHVPFQVLVYMGQILLSVGSIYYVCWNLLSCEDKPADWRKCLFYSLGIMTIPVVNFLNLTLLTDSLALSFMLVILVQIGKVWKCEKLHAVDIGLLAAAFLLETLVRADRIYSCTLYLLVYSVIYLIKKVNWRRFVIVIVTVVLTACMAIGINRGTQTPGLYGRVSTNFDFVLLDRVVWPNMASNYDDFSEDIKNSISMEEAMKFDEHNNNVMYYLAPMLEERVGTERASMMYREMAATVWKNEAGKVMRDTAKCFLGFFFPHTNAYLSYHGKTETNNGWDLHCWATKTAKFTDVYYHYYIFFFGIVIFSITIVLSILKLMTSKNSSLHDAGFVLYAKKLVPYIAMSALICAWFSLGDGAPPNDRYVTLCHVVWNLWMYGCFEHDLSADR